MLNADVAVDVDVDVAVAVDVKAGFPAVSF